MVAAPSQRFPSQAPSKGRRSLELIQGSLSANKVARQAPWLAGLHRVADGALAGLGLSMVGLAGLSLHWQTQWTQSYQRFEATQVLEHRLQESAAVLEQHHLGAAHRPGLLVPTSTEKLVYLNTPKPRPTSPMSSLLAGISTRQVLPGY
ncbi:hypothetical protein [Cyanobium sp. ATX 6F1]|uniref:hypothetical protein n=1 Tax=unclassified Cyanobium TaxID=2627006 RepID=UPI0020CDF9A9|nr:hypothetical protein [Cyanobium sp. ATX 6F1]MCP9915460.1 hypothetical protein [Cyanobium sp. ATX 6F1]